MQLDRLLPYLGAAACLVFVAIAAGPFLLIEGHDQLVADYYAAGPLGITGAVFLAGLGAVIFLSGVRGQADPLLVSGIMLAVGVTVFVVAVLWMVSIESTVLFSFPEQYAWLEHHPWTTVAVSGVVASIAGGYAVVTN